MEAQLVPSAPFVANPLAVRKARKAAGLTQDALARRLGGNLGSVRAQISHVETGRALHSHLLPAMAEALGVSVAVLQGYAAAEPAARALPTAANEEPRSLTWFCENGGQYTPCGQVFDTRDQAERWAAVRPWFVGVRMLVDVVTLLPPTRRY